MQISYNTHGVAVSYVLMTTGSYSGSATGSTTTSRQVSVQRSTSVIPVLQETTATARSETADEPPMLTHSMAPPPPPRRQQPAAGLSGSQAQAQSTQSQTQTQTQRRRLPGLQKSAVSVAHQAGPDDEPLFVSNDEEDRVWDAANLDDGQEEDELAWDAMGDMVSLHDVVDQVRRLACVRGLTFDADAGQTCCSGFGFTVRGVQHPTRQREFAVAGYSSNAEAVADEWTVRLIAMVGCMPSVCDHPSSCAARKDLRGPTLHV